MRPRSRRAAFGPLSATEEKSPRTALPKAHQPPSAAHQATGTPLIDALGTGKPILDAPLTARYGAGKGRFNFLYREWRLMPSAPLGCFTDVSKLFGFGRPNELERIRLFPRRDPLVGCEEWRRRLGW